MSAEENKSLDDLAREREKQKKEREQNRQEREKLIEHARELEEEKKNRPIKLKTRPVPAVVTLIGGATAGIVVSTQHYPLYVSLIVVLLSLCAFLVVGDLIKILLDKVELPPPKDESEEVGDDGEMIEKGPAEGADTVNIDSETDGTVEQRPIEEDAGQI